jgi:hypothetical protein
MLLCDARAARGRGRSPADTHHAPVQEKRVDCVRGHRDRVLVPCEPGLRRRQPRAGLRVQLELRAFVGGKLGRCRIIRLVLGTRRGPAGRRRRRVQLELRGSSGSSSGAAGSSSGSSSSSGVAGSSSGSSSGSGVADAGSGSAQDSGVKKIPGTIRIMPLGDSITGSTCWRALLWQELNTNGFTGRFNFDATATTGDTVDGVHPNDSGNVKMANNWYAALAPFF